MTNWQKCPDCGKVCAKLRIWGNILVGYCLGCDLKWWGMLGTEHLIGRKGGKKDD